jgi:lipopolysaccharide export system permease protein
MVRVRILDRYIIREILLPFAIALVVLSFVLIIPFIIELAEQLIQKGVSGPTILQLMVTLLPATLGLTIPMALLIAVLMAFGRLSGDREIVVLMACGVSPYRLLRPVFGLALVAAAATLWVMIEAIPNANQSHREITTRIVADRAEGQVRPRVFFEDFPNTVLYVRDVPPTGGWLDVVAADTRNATQPILYVAKSGRMVVNREARTIQMVLEDGAQHRTKPPIRPAMRSRASRSWSSRSIPRACSRALALPEASGSSRSLSCRSCAPHSKRATCPFIGP